MYKKNNRILILIPGPEARGGITAYYKALTPLFSLPVDYMRRGSRKWPQKDKFLFELLRIIKDIFRFWRLIRKKEYSLVLTNTSFSSQAILRDGFFLIIARFYKIRTVVFFHGWDYEFAKKIEHKYFIIFKRVFFKADALIDLAQRNVNQLKDWGYNKKIFLETTVVDKDLIKEVDEDKIIEKYTSKTYNILFLARLEKTKGIYEAIETFAILKRNHKNLRMTIAGDGSEEDNIKDYISDRNLDRITLLGFVEERAKIAAYSDSHIYLFPSYFEGMPTSLLEAMAFGLPVITRKVGGISDFFENAKNGYITESKEPSILASLIEKVIINENTTYTIGINNYRFAKEHFVSDKVVERMENIFFSVLDE